MYKILYAHIISLLCIKPRTTVDLYRSTVFRLCIVTLSLFSIVCILARLAHSMRACLPRLDHLSREDFLAVYEPSDDTFLLCDALLNDLPHLLALAPTFCCEIGTGSGTVITYLHQILKEHNYSAVYIATDLNPKACSIAAKTAKMNECRVDSLRMNFTESMLDRQIDVLIFNPPYVPTPNEEIAGSGIEIAWAGGEDGRVVIDRFIDQLDSMLSPKGVLYMILVQDNKPAEVRRILRRLGFLSAVVLQRKAVNEDLLVLKAWRA